MIQKLLNHPVFRYLYAGAISQIVVLFFWTYISTIIALDIIGDFHSIIFWVELVSLVSLMGITTYYAKLYYISVHAINDNRIFFGLVLISIILLILYFLFVNENSQLVFVFTLAVMGRIIFDYYLNILVVRNQSLTVAKFQILRSITLLFSGIALVYLRCDSSFIILTAYALSFLIPGIGVFFAVNKEPKYNVITTSVRRILLESYPYMIVGLIGVFGAYSTRLVAISLFSKNIVGIIGLFVSYTAPVLAVLAAINKFYYPKSIESLSSNGNLPYNPIFVSGIALLYTAVLCLLISSDIIHLLISEDIWRYKNIFYGMLILVIPHIAYVYISPYILYEKGRYLVFQNFSYVLASIVLQYFFFSIYGLDSIEYVLVIAELLQLILLMLFVSFKSTLFKFNRGYVLLLALVFTCPLFVLYLL